MASLRSEGSTTLSSPFKNVVRLATGDLLAKATSFFAFVYLARILGVTGFGVLEFAGSVLAYVLLIADGGLEMWGTREAAQAADIPALAGRVLPLRILLATFSFLILLAVLPLFPGYPYLRTVLLIYGLSVFAAATNLKWIFTGQQKMTGVARGLVIGQAMFAVLVVVFVHKSGALLWVPVFRLLSDSASAVYFAQWYRREYGHAGLKLTFRDAAAVIKPAFTIGASLGMGLLNYNFDSVLLGFLRGPKVVGWYNAAYKVQLVGISVALSYFAGLFPVLSKTYAGNREEFRHVVRGTVELWLGCVVPLVVAGTFLADPIVRVLYGPAYAASAEPFRILVWSAAFVVLRWVYMDSLRATGHQGLDLRCAITSAALNVGLNIVLIPRFGMIGAASATVFADLVWFVMSYYYFRHAVLSDEPLQGVAGPLLGGTAMCVVLWFARPLNWPLQLLFSMVVYLLIQAQFGAVARVKTLFRQ
jgi:O-antigen/teichoic acid export membrane protein